MRRAASRAACTAGNKRATSTPMMAITTNSSTRVKPERRLDMEGTPELGLAGFGRGRFRLFENENLIGLWARDFLRCSARPANLELLDFRCLAQAERDGQLRLGQVAVRGRNDSLLDDSTRVQPNG